MVVGKPSNCSFFVDVNYNKGVVKNYGGVIIVFLGGGDVIGNFKLFGLKYGPEYRRITTSVNSTWFR